MRSNKKFLCALLAFLSLACASVFFTHSAAAYRIEIGLPNLPPGTDVTDPAKYIEYFFVFGLILCGFLAVAAIVWGGITYMLAGTITTVEKAKSVIFGAITGIVLLLCSYLLLATIDPTLTNLSPFRPPPAGNIPAAPSAPPAATRNCNPPCTAGFFCRASDYTCQPIPTNADPSVAACMTPGQCLESNCAPSGRGRCTVVSSVPLVWNPNTCTCVRP